MIYLRLLSISYRKISVNHLRTENFPFFVLFHAFNVCYFLQYGVQVICIELDYLSVQKFIFFCIVRKLIETIPGPIFKILVLL